MWLVELWLEGEDGTAESQDGDQTPVGDLQGGITYEAVVDQRDIGAPHKEYNSLKIELHAERERSGTVAHERMETVQRQYKHLPSALDTTDQAESTKHTATPKK